MYSKSEKLKVKSAKLQTGQTLLELIVVVSVSVIVIGALVFATIASLRNAQFSKNQLQATKLAQEGIERVRIGRDRNQCIAIPLISVNSWNGNNSACTSSGALWDYHISGDCQKEQPGLSSKCYFNVSPTGALQNIGFSLTSFPDSAAEPIPPAPETAVFKRVIILSDDINDNKIFTDDSYQSAKKVTAVVKWSDFAGDHQSVQTTILGNQIQ